MKESFWKVSKVEGTDLFVVHTTNNMHRQYLMPDGKPTKDFFKARFHKTLDAANEALESVYDTAN